MNREQERMQRARVWAGTSITTATMCVLFLLLGVCSMVTYLARAICGISWNVAAVIGLLATMIISVLMIKTGM